MEKQEMSCAINKLLFCSLKCFMIAPTNTV